MVYYLKWEVDDQPVIQGTDVVKYNILHLNQSKREIVLVVAIDSIELVVSIVFKEDGIYQNLHWGQEDHECEVVNFGVRDSAAETTPYHVCRQDKEANDASVEEGLCSF